MIKPSIQEKEKQAQLRKDRSDPFAAAIEQVRRAEEYAEFERIRHNLSVAENEVRTRTGIHDPDVDWRIFGPPNRAS